MGPEGSSGSFAGQDNVGSEAKKSPLSARRSRERELERKRARGEVSCAECRRLKLKCNKKVPCASCIRRGCHSICPNGLLTTGQGSRFVLANTDKLHSKLLQMSQRIRELEDALQIAQTCISKTPHPLLTEDMLSIKAGVDSLSNDKVDDVVEEEDDMATAFGTLTVTEHGEARFVGRTAVDTLLVNEPGDDLHMMIRDSETETEPDLNLPAELLFASKDFPFVHTLLPKDQLFEIINENLPTYERATALAEAYLQNVAWLPRPIGREQIFEDLIPLIYKGRRVQLSCEHPDDDDEGNEVKKHRMHNFALALAVFACGAAADLTLPPNNAEGNIYNHLARAALGTQSIVANGASLETVQTITLIAEYEFFSATKQSLEYSWKMLSFGLILGISIGLHRDPAYWSTEPRHMQRRRNVFWELASLDKWKSLGTGRPSVFHISEVDCEFPEDEEAFVDDDGKTVEGLRRWRYRFAKGVVGPMAETFCLTRPIKFSEIMEFDRKIRDFDEPPIHERYLGGAASDTVKWRMWNIFKEIALLFIHRNFFARAMIKDTGNPLRSPFAPSFLAAYASAINLLRNIRTYFYQNGAIMIRMWPIWAHCLTAAVIIGSVASKVNQIQLATAAFQDLDHAITLFRDASMHPVCKRGLPILLRLRQRSTTALQKFIGNAELHPSCSPQPKTEKDEMEELRLLRGATRLVHRKTKKADSSGARSPSRSSKDNASASNSSGASNSSSPSPMLAMESVITPPSFPQTSSDGIPSGKKVPFDAIFATTPAENPSQSFQPPYTGNTIDQDLAIFFNAVYSESSRSSDLGVLPAPVKFNAGGFRSPGQMPQDSSVDARDSQFGFDAMNAPDFFLTGASSSLPATTWPPEATHPGTSNIGEFRDPQPSIDAMLGSNSMNSSYDFNLSSEGDVGGISDMSGDAAQFVADWRFLASIEGLVSDPTMDTYMAS